MIFFILNHNLIVFAEQSGSSPESGTDSKLKTAYDWLVAKGDNYGGVDAADWTNDWGTQWNRIMEAAAWEPGGTATDVFSGTTYYAGNNNRTIQTGTGLSLITNQAYQDYDDYNCTNNNGESDSSCAAGDSEYTGEESTWTLTASGGTVASVTDNSVTVSLTSNKVYKDSLTGLYWSDTTSSTIDNEFAYVDGDDRTNPTGNSCNFNSTGTANSYCDNQDPNSAYTEDNDVSANDFCLNLELDADNADSDSDGTTGTETDWRLPTQKELMQACIDGAINHVPTINISLWSNTEDNSTQSNARWLDFVRCRANSTNPKSSNIYAMCVRK